MGFVVETLEQAAMVDQVVLDRKLWLVADKTRVVEDGDPEAAFLYGTKGDNVPRKEAKKLGALPKKDVAKEKAAAAKARRQQEGHQDKLRDRAEDK